MFDLIMQAVAQPEVSEIAGNVIDLVKNTL